MRILHLYSWSSLSHCQQRLDYIDTTDTLLIYGSFTPQDQCHLLKQAPFLTGRCVWLSKAIPENPEIVNINHQQWLTLLSEHDKTHTWK